MRNDVRILLVGESGVGKTSVILSLISEEFPENVPAKAEEITIPADITPERVPTQIVDYSAQEQTNSELVEEIEKADVVCIVYSVENVDSIQKIPAFWIPLIHSLSKNVNKPIVLVGNKTDLLEISSMELIMPVMNMYAEIETCVECSAKTLKNISEVFYYAQKAVLHPTAPLYLLDEKQLSLKCKSALTRIFRICDQDNDGLLNDNEIYQFQRRCFNVPLQPQALEDVKSVVRRHIDDGVVREALTLKAGFLFLHTLFIQRGRHETTWTVLRKFGFDDNLNLPEELFKFGLRNHPGSTVELSYLGYQFLSDLFDKFDDDCDGCLSPTELTNLSNLCNHDMWSSDFSNIVCTNSHGWITQQGFLAFWTLTTYIDVTKTMEFLASTGYTYEHDNLASAIQITRDKRIDIEKKHSTRIVYKCVVLGSKGCGKSTFLQGLLNRNLHYVKTLDYRYLPDTTVNLVSVCGQEKYLVLNELDENNVQSNLTSDIICLLYDVSNPSSFEFCANCYLQYLSTSWLPVCVIGCKTENKVVIQDFVMQPKEFCTKYNLTGPILISCLEKINRDVYVQLTTLAAYP
ncbi:hypothetical protein HELRODRAFT_63612 [Helobdella robusta]|uniref:Mitochondrial Rho GTPase n=1 Tax=Helobdella robusta TaxID=6412 RepID=T1FXI2_HELRO|nr:hypothetical protein HELRODRAFT_63612 [Helobdella robusta]ESO12001.1 hypothetical protein HELRODRAFT_63612 [Helobdella robusta]